MKKNVSIITLQNPVDVHDLEIRAPFVCLIYSNQNVNIDDISLVADWLISSGCLYAVCAGKDCETWHDTIDEISVIKDVEDAKTELIMTTWHENESIEEVVWFWLNSTNFDNKIFENYLCLIIDDSKLMEEEIQQTIKENSI